MLTVGREVHEHDELTIASCPCRGGLPKEEKHLVRSDRRRRFGGRQSVPLLSSSSVVDAENGN